MTVIVSLCMVISGVCKVGTLIFDDNARLERSDAMNGVVKRTAERRNESTKQ